MTGPKCRYCADRGYLVKPCPRCGAFRDRATGRVVYVVASIWPAGTADPRMAR